NGVSLRREGAEPVDLEALLSTLGRIRFKMLEEGEAVWDPKKKPPVEEMREVRVLIDRFVEKVKEKRPGEVYQALTAYQEELVQDLGDKLDLFRLNLEAKPITLIDLPQALRDRFVGRNGRYRLLVFPAEDIWEPGPLERFVQELRTVDPNAIGDPVLGFEHMRAMKEGYKRAGLYTLLGVSLLAFLTFREWRSFLLALIPLAGGSLWTLGLMGLFRIKFNLANLIVLPLITAPAVESGIMIVSRFREERGKGKGPIPLPKSTGRAVAFSALSTMVGFGSLMISRHRGIFSIGLLLTFGVGCVLLASLTVLPALLQVTSSPGRGTGGGRRRGEGNRMRVLNLEAFRKTPLTRDPFEFVIVPGFLKREAKPFLDADFPHIAHPGSFPVSELAYGTAFQSLLEELRGPEFEEAVSEKFRIDLSQRPTMITVRGRCQKRDGQVHTDAAWKLITVLLYLNDRWEPEGGRLRLLRSRNLEDAAAEVPPEWGMLVAFRVSDRSWHGHRPFEGERRVVQLNWVTDQRVVDREVARHRRSARLKRLIPFAWVGGY
ncbi:MAG: MMPL family transporter, partial [Candidatus Methylomirabilales bacterium]